MPGNDSYTKLLLHCNGADKSTSFPDDSTSNHTVTPVGNAQIDTAQSEFGGASALFNGTGDYLSVPDSADWFMDAGKFTIDGWFRFGNVVSIQSLWAQVVDGVNFSRLRWTTGGGGTLYFNIFVGTEQVLLSATWTPTINTWYHIAVIRGWGGNVNDWALTVGGTSVGTTTDASAWPDFAAIFYVGGVTMPLYAHVDEFRISKGIARWTTNFTPSVGPYNKIASINGVAWPPATVNGVAVANIKSVMGVE